MLFINVRYKIKVRGGDVLYDANKETQKLIENLQDAGINGDSITEFMNYYQSQQSVNYMRFLRNYRAKLLTDIRDRQEKLFCLDYLMRNLNEKDNMYK